MSIPKIQEYSFGRIGIDGRAYDADVIVHPEGVKPDWWRLQGHTLDLRDLDSIWIWSPIILVVGTGMSGLMEVPGETGRLIHQKGIELVVERTKQACQIYNHLSTQKRTVAALHLTC